MKQTTSENDFSLEETTAYGNSAALTECVNCGTTSGFITRVWVDDHAKPILLCEDCAEAERTLETLAEKLAAMPSCEVRERIIDSTEFTRQLVNALKAHDEICLICRLPKKFESIQGSLFTLREVA